MVESLLPGKPTTKSQTVPKSSVKSLAHFDLKPVGTLESVFREKFGTPKQSQFVKAARAKLRLKKEISSQALEGLQEFNYVWILFIFHLDLENREEETKGMFASRDSNRVNPIGMTLAHLDKIEGKTLYLSGIDAIHGSPVVDIKPYHYKDAVFSSTGEPEYKPSGLETKFLGSAA